MDTSVCIINELTQGMELAMLLKSMLSSESSSQTTQVLIEEIISSYNRVMFMVNLGQPPALPLPTLTQPESSVSIDESPHSHEFNQPFDNQLVEKLVSKKRKVMPTWQDQVRISADNGVEGNTDDGYSWRKYGQKVILGAKFPRSYYRCTYRNSHSCVARKQVQRTDADPTVFEITYKGQHTCNPREIKQNNHQRPLPPKTGQMLSNLKENLRVITSDLDASVPCSFSFPTASFETAENYQRFNFSNEDDDSIFFQEWGNDFQHRDDSNLSGVISATGSATNSPLAFPADPQDHSLNFEFDNSGFFI